MVKLKCKLWSISDGNSSWFPVVFFLFDFFVLFLFPNEVSCFNFLFLNFIWMRSEIGEFLFHYSHCFPAAGLMFLSHAVREPQPAEVHHQAGREALVSGRPWVPGSLIAPWSPGFWVPLKLWWPLVPDGATVSLLSPAFVFILRNLQFKLFNIKVSSKAQWVGWSLRDPQESSLENLKIFWKITISGP